MNTLPPDLLRLIFSEQYPRGSQLSRRYQSILSPTAYQTLCQLPISKSEVNTYYQQFPRNIALFYTLKDVTSFDLYRLNGINPDFDPTDNIFNRISFYCHFTEKPAEDENGDEIYLNAYEFYFPDEFLVDYNWSKLPQDLEKQSPTVFDILSQYHIFNQRLGCININPTYVKNHLLSLFDQIIDRYLNHSNPIYILDLYCYLIGHTWIFNILYPVPREEIFILVDDDRFPLPGEMEKPVIVQIKSDITELIAIIKRKINQLD